jgi:hypothetical protein
MRRIFLTSALVGGEWSASSPCLFTSGERTLGAYWIRGWVGPRAGLDDVEKRKFLTLPGLELQFLGRPGRSQSQTGCKHLLLSYVISIESVLTGSWHEITKCE